MRILAILFLLVITYNSYAQTGIGTTAPVNKFQVETTTADPATSGTAANGNLRLGGLSVNHVLDFGLSSTSNFAWLQARSKSAYGTNYPIVLNPNGGGVGIGTSSPSSTLTIGNAAGTIGGEIILNPTTTQYEGGQIVFKKSLVGSTVDWTIDQYGTTAVNARFRIFNGASETNGIAILENGNIGMGTAVPTAKLNLVGGGIRIFDGFGNSTARPGLNTSTIGNYEIRGVGAGGGSTQGDGYDDGFLRLSAGGGTNSNTQASIDLSGYSNVADMGSNILMRTAGTERFRINADGKIGVGTSSPSTMFHIQNGNAIGSGDPGNNTVPSIYLYNTNSASTSAHSIMSIRTNGSGGGNPYISYDISGIRGYSMGIDNADSDKFKIIPNWSFSNINTPMLTIDSDLRVGIGTASPSRRLHVQSSDNTSVYVESTTSDNNGMVIFNANTDQNWGPNFHEFLMFQKQGNTIGQIIAASNGSAVTYNTNSDYRLKTDLRDFNGLDIINKIKTYDFAWKENSTRMYGVMAHELQEILPYAVAGIKDSIDVNGKMIPQGVDYGRITPVLVKAIQEQDETIKNLKKDKERLEQMLKEIQERLLKLENKGNE
ncbi:tail fiber domain-containing protein [Aquirufa sp. 5-AUSEE-100C1]